MADNGEHKGHRARLKQTFNESGLRVFNDIQALEFILFYAIPNGDTNPTAHRLLDRFGTLKDVFEADYSELIKVKGIGEHAALLITLFKQASQRYLISSALDLRAPMQDISGIRCYFERVFMGEREEQLRAMVIDNELKFIAEDVVVTGISERVDANMSALLKFIYRYNSSRVIIAHNHPDGASLPSKADIAATEEIVKLFDKLGLTLMDHIIIGKTGSYSMLSAKLRCDCLRDGDRIFSLKDVFTG